jgi:hypothetical protein
MVEKGNKQPREANFPGGTQFGGRSTDEDGVTVGSFEYYPFGETKVTTGCRESDQRFTGKPLDAESGLQYY